MTEAKMIVMEAAKYNWTEKPVIGLSLLIMGGSIDSYGEQIIGLNYYMVGKHKETGQVAIVPSPPKEGGKGE